MSEALITGASSGLGAEFARQLAQQGWNLILVARRKDALQAIADELSEAYGVDVHVLAADLAEIHGREAVASMIAGRPVCPRLVINNAGFSIPAAFASQPWENHQGMIDVNITAMTQLSHALAKRIQEDHDRMDQDHVLAAVQPVPSLINVASVAAFAGVGLYSGAKRYQVLLSRRIARQMAGRLAVQALCPGFVRTGFHSTEAYSGSKLPGRVPGFMWLSAGFVVRKSLAHIRRQQRRAASGKAGRPVAVPSWRYALLVRLARLAGL
ncbi:MAG: SDR family NAD(P)-dependent oxidoreductase [Spirochaetaceae bacterium]|nr:MAG: SDR family NAD(P)-dependent oxidoreductase [Spirochaetaceae bacterium]